MEAEQSQQETGQQPKQENTIKLLSKVRTEYYLEILNRSRIPKRYFKKEIETFEGNNEVIEKSINAMVSGESVFISGKCGVGKTHLAIGLLKKWAREETLRIIPDEKKIDDIRRIETPPIFLPSVDLFFELKSSFNNDSISESEIIGKYVKCPLLIIDDVGSEKVSDWSRQVFYLLVDRRYRDMKPTIITSNLSLQQIAEVIDERISSRICEMGIVTELIGKDRRLD